MYQDFADAELGYAVTDSQRAELTPTAGQPPAQMGQWIIDLAAAHHTFAQRLANRFGIARETAARAHAWLARAGYLVAVPGVGMVVTPASRWPEDAI